MPWSPGDFYGHADGLDWFKDVSGGVIAAAPNGGDEMTYYWDDTDSLTFSAGNSFMGEVYPDYIYDPVDPVVFTVVVECGPATNGTFNVKVGGDPAWNLTSPSLATVDLGTYGTSLGARRIVCDPVPTGASTAWTVANWLSYDEQPLIFVEVLTGVVEILQIRIRVWPEGGTAGAWVDTTVPTWTETNLIPEIYVSDPGSVAITSSPNNTAQTIAGGGPRSEASGPGLWGGYDDYDPTGGSEYDDYSNAVLDRVPLLPNFKYFRKKTGSQFIQGVHNTYWTLRSIGNPSHDWTGGGNPQAAVFDIYRRSAASNPTGSTYDDPDRIRWERAGGLRDKSTKGTVWAAFGGWTGTMPSFNVTGGENYNCFDARSYTIAGGAPFQWDQVNTYFSGTFITDVFDTTGFPASQTDGDGYGYASDETITLPAAPAFVEVIPTILRRELVPGVDFTFTSSPGIGDYTHGNRYIAWDGNTLKWTGAYGNAEYFNPALPYVSDDPGPEPVPVTAPSWWNPLGSTQSGVGSGLVSSNSVYPGSLVDCLMLGTGTHRVFLFDRGGQRRIAEIKDLSLVRWRRTRDDISNASVAVLRPSPECCAILANIAVGRHEIVIYRNGSRVWEGPITLLTYKGDVVEIEAEDVCFYLARTAMRRAYDNRYSAKNSRVGPVTRRAQAILANELVRKEALTPPINVLRYLDVRTNAKTTRTSRYTPAYYSSVWEEIDYMAAKLSLDYTAIGRRIVINDVHDVLSRTQMLTDKDFLDPIVVTTYGKELATRSAVSDGQGHWAAVGGVDSFYGEVELVHTNYGETVRYADPNHPTAAELKRLTAEFATQAQRNIAGRYPVPTVVRVPDGTRLSPNAPVVIEQLIAGVRVPIRASMACLDLQQEQKLDSVTVEETGGVESVTVTLSPAPGTSPWDDSSETSED